MIRKIFVEDDNNHYNIGIDAPLEWQQTLGYLEDEIIRYQLEFTDGITDEDTELFKELDRIQEKLFNLDEELRKFVANKFVNGLKGKHFTREL